MNSEASVEVSLSGDEALTRFLEKSLSGMCLKILGENLWLKSSTSESAVSPDLHVMVANNLTAEQAKTLLGSHSLDFGYLINVIPESGSGEERATPKTVIAELAMKHNFCCRDCTLDSLKTDVLERDIANCLHIIRGSQVGKERAALVHRFLLTQIYQDECSLHLAESSLLFFKEDSPPGVVEVWPIGFDSLVLQRSQLEQLQTINRVQNRLWLKVANDKEFLIEKFGYISEDEPFIDSIVQILKKVKDSATAQTAKLCYSRNDFFEDRQGRFLQVEPNMWGCGYGPLGDRYLKGLEAIENVFGLTSQSHQNYTSFNEECLAEGLEAAWRHYGNPDAVVIMVSSSHWNAFDMFAPCKPLAAKGIRYLRYSLEELEDLLEFDPTTGIATVLGKEIAVVYYRDGFLPEFYHEKTWKVREQLELSKAVKAPDIGFQLTNTKYMQYLMGMKETWIHFGYSEAEYQEHSQYFAPIFSISDFEDSPVKMRDYIIENGGHEWWVLKPNRDGGGHNIFGSRLLDFIQSSSANTLRGFILQRKIDVVPRLSLLSCWRRSVVREVDDEIGLFHYLFVDGDQIISEKEGGCLIVSKLHDKFESGKSDDDYLAFCGLRLKE